MKETYWKQIFRHV